MKIKTIAPASEQKSNDQIDLWDLSKWESEMAIISERKLVQVPEKDIPQSNNKSDPISPGSLSEMSSSELKLDQALKKGISRINYDELTLIKKLGEGGFSQVFEGIYKEKTVAIKNSKPMIIWNKSLYGHCPGQLSKELEIMTQLLGLRNMVQVFAVVCRAPHYCLVMEYCKGGSLSDLLYNRSVNIPYIEQLRLAVQLSFALHTLYTRQIIHGDLNSNNIFLDELNHIKIGDFGSAKIGEYKLSNADKITESGMPELKKADVPQEMRLYAENGFASYWAWASPEIYASLYDPDSALGDIKYITDKADIYSLGKLINAIVSRDKLNKNPSRPKMIYLEDLPPLPEKCPDIFRKTISECCALDPRKRPSAEQVANRFLAEYMKHQPVLRPVMPLKSELSSSFTASPALQELLQCVVAGEQKKAETLISRDEKLLLQPGTVQDLSGREFKQITAFQYALWARDLGMWTMIGKYLPAKNQAGQLQELETKKTEYGRHFKLKGLMAALEFYLVISESMLDEQKRAAHWRKIVGKHLQLVPAHVVNEYGRPSRSLLPPPSTVYADLINLKSLWQKRKQQFESFQSQLFPEKAGQKMDLQ